MSEPKPREPSPIRGAIFFSERVLNRSRKFGSATHYYICYLTWSGQVARPLLFTTDQLGDAAKRADANPEDCGAYIGHLPPAAVEDLWLVPAMCVASTTLGLLFGWAIWGAL